MQTSTYLNYEGFKAFVLDHILEYLDTENVTYIEITPITKNNKVVLDGLSITEEGHVARPVIYLHHYFEDYILGDDLATVMGAIAQAYREYRQEEPVITSDDLFDFYKVKDRIIWRVVNFEANKEMLAGSPHVPKLDLALTYRILVNKTDGGLSTTMIYYKHIRQWNISEAELSDLALVNTQRLFKPTILAMSSALEIFRHKKSLVKTVTDSFEVQMNRALRILKHSTLPLYVLSNDLYINGATVMFYPGILEQISQTLMDNFYLFPSSIHEVLLLPAKEVNDEETLGIIVKQVNQDVTKADEILSDCVYYYDLAHRELSRI